MIANLRSKILRALQSRLIETPVQIDESELAPVINKEILIDIAAERRRQEDKWGEQNHPWGIWGLILGEEYGEACQRALQHNFGKAKHGEHHRVPELRDELIQVAAVAVVMIDYLDRTYGPHE